MKRVPIRNLKSDKKVKPRVCDALIFDDGKVVVQFKTGRNHSVETVSYEDFKKQIEKYRK